MAGIPSRVYNAIFRRTSTFALVCVVGALVFERVLDVGTNYAFETINRGVSIIHAI